MKVFYSSEHVGRRVGMRNVVRYGLTLSNRDPRFTGVVSGGTKHTIIVQWDAGKSSELPNEWFRSTMYFISTMS